MSRQSKRSPSSAKAELLQSGPLWLLSIVAFLVPLIGGAVSTDPMPVEPGYAPTMRAIFGGTDLPILSHAVLSLLVCASAIWILVTRRIIQVPMPAFGVLSLGFFGVVTASWVFSAHAFVSAMVVAEWLVYAVAAFAAVAIVGRKLGPRRVLIGLFAGNVLLALLGVWEFLALTNDPNWRIFGTWQNPNALAGMLLLGFFVGIGLLQAASKIVEVAALAAGVSSIGVALALTQSKGAYLAATGGLCVVMALVLGWLLGRRGIAPGAFGKVLLCLVVLAAVLAGLRLRSGSEGPAAAPLARIGQAESTQEQSAGFRRLLWQSAIKLAQQKPLGWGMGTYRYESARPGLTTQTHLAHNSFLQLAAEAGVLAPVLLAALGFVWIGYAFRGVRKQPPEALTLKIGILAAISAATIHNLIDSDLHYFGTGLAFFLLLGLGLQLNADGVTPESVQRPPRLTAMAVAALLPAVLFYFGAIEATKGHVKWHASRNAVEPAQEGAESLASWAPGDGEAWYQRALFEVDPARRIEWLQAAWRRGPTTRIARALARDQLQAGQIAEAASTLRSSLTRDPNNLLTLKLLMDVYEKGGDTEGALETARRLVKVEESSAFRIRALPELVPTETYFARQKLAARAEPKEKAQLLWPAFRGLLDYAKKTVPNIATAVEAGLPQGYAGETAQDGIEKMKAAQGIAHELSEALRSARATVEASQVEAESESFSSAIARLGG